MATVNLGLKIGNSGGVNIEQKDQTWIQNQEFKRIYYVVADLGSDELDVLSTSGIPVIGVDIIGTAICKGLSAKETDRVNFLGSPAMLWEVEATFDSKVDQGQAGEEDPLDLPIRRRWYGENEDEVLEKDAITGDPITTACGEPIIITAPVCRPILELTRYENYPIDPDTILEFSNHVNDSTFYGAPEGSALMMPIEADKETIKGVDYDKVTYRIKFNIREDESSTEDSWMARPLHHGYKFFPIAGAAWPATWKIKGQPATVNLAADGTALDNDADPFYLAFNRFKKANFNSLSLGP
jgi:hypothetical protein